jgi:class 3 adenylate cyclase
MAFGRCFPRLARGTVTFLLSDVEGSSARWEADPAAMSEAVARHDECAEAIVGRHRGALLKTRGEGDSLFAAFLRATDAAAAALDLQIELSDVLPVRVALHTGEAELRNGDYFGTAVNRCARIRAVNAAHGVRGVAPRACSRRARARRRPSARRARGARAGQPLHR